MEKRVLFRSAWLPWLLVAPQMAVILVFFFWPASQAIWQSLQSEDAFGTSTAFVGLENFQTLFDDPPTSSPSRSRHSFQFWWPAAASRCR